MQNNRWHPPTNTIPCHKEYIWCSQCQKNTSQQGKYTRYLRRLEHNCRLGQGHTFLLTWRSDLKHRKLPLQIPMIPDTMTGQMAPNPWWQRDQFYCRNNLLEQERIWTKMGRFRYCNIDLNWSQSTEPSAGRCLKKSLAC